MGPQGLFLHMIEQSMGVQLTARDTWVKIDGSDLAINKTVRFLSIVRQMRNKGIPIHKQVIQFTMDACLQGRESEIESLYELRIDVSPGKDPIYPRTFGQRKYVQDIVNQDITFGIGPAGTGKTYLAMAAAVSHLLDEKVSRIILTRPAIEAGEALGFLPGDFQQKVFPYLRPLYDALYDMMNPADIEKHIERGIIEVAPLAYMRGRTLNHAFVILDEAQNSTAEQMMMFLTRLGFDSKCVITGDLTQIDLPSKQRSGLIEAQTILRKIPGIAFAELSDHDVVRHTLVQKIIQAYRQHRSVPSHTI